MTVGLLHGALTVLSRLGSLYRPAAVCVTALFLFILSSGFMGVSNTRVWWLTLPLPWKQQRCPITFPRHIEAQTVPVPQADLQSKMNCLSFGPLIFWLRVFTFIQFQRNPMQTEQPVLCVAELGFMTIDKVHSGSVLSPMWYIIIYCIIIPGPLTMRDALLLYHQPKGKSHFIDHKTAWRCRF